ncbi:hypothetical protein BKA66DRAFT_229143 [Pyrenochaeta sp. MPI-SDFR-AT-0127]|nr:hypothetical protein BKA66DRAFT_229143 [Pyrenochaeta sp. MPI-SDFR-AT-0127]
MLVSRVSLTVTLLWASTAVATHEVIAESLFNRGLEVRQTATKCPDNFTSKNGLNFTTYCEQNNPFNDAQPPFTSPNMQDCMEHCSRFWNEDKGEGCFGIVWVEENGQCWIRNSTTSTAPLTSAGGHYSALIKTGEMEALNKNCPNADLSVNSLPGIEGMQYTTHCGKVISGFDDCFSGSKPCWPTPYKGFYHAESLEDCLKICIDEHPLCRAVSWNPTMEIGFANCWLKTGFSDTLTTPGLKMGTLHSATITQIDTVDTTCPSSKTIQAQGSKSFEIHCGQLNTGSNITSIHTKNVTACIDACSTSDKSCVGILFDSTLAGGYRNCYLQNSTAVISNQASATYAVLVGSSAPSSSGTGTPGTPNGNNGNSSSGSRAWIAGPVIGGIAGLAIIGFAIFWWRRRKAAAASGIEKQHGARGYGPAPAYSPGAQGSQSYYDAPATEMDGRATGELPASTKYAHEKPMPPPRFPPQELPS